MAGIGSRLEGTYLGVVKWMDVKAGVPLFWGLFLYHGSSILVD